MNKKVHICSSCIFPALVNKLISTVNCEGDIILLNALDL